MLYYFILGHNPHLSILEIYRYLQGRGINFNVEKFSDEVLLVDIKKEIEAEKMVDDLGGTIKIGEIIIQTAPQKINPEFIVNQVITNPKYQIRDTKYSFGFSFYSLSSNKFKLPRNIGLEIKKLLKEKEISSRLVISKEKNLSSVTVAKNRLLKNGAEICFIADQNNIYLGKTLAVQKFGEYSKYDFGRPGRDPYSGMLPPKAAKIMINLGQVQSPSPAKGRAGVGSVVLNERPPLTPPWQGEEPVILDPFCGSGTILQEATRLGYENLTGCDISPKAIEDTKNNFQFLISNFKTITNIQYSILIQELHILDAIKLSNKIKPNSIDAIITEPFLGPPLKGSENEMQIKKIIKELSTLYLKSFQEFTKVLKAGSRVVIIFPILKNIPSMSDNDLREVEKMGFKNDFEVPKELKSILTPRQSIIYSRPGQNVVREIFVFNKI